MVFQAAFFLLLAVPLAAGLWRWLSGRADVNRFQLVSNLVMFATLVLSWNTVKSSNRAAVRALQEEIDASEAAKKKSVGV